MGKQQTQMVSVIQFCKLVGIAHAQQFYSMKQKGKVPKEIIVTQKFGDREQDFLKKDEAIAWWNARKTAKANNVRIVASADQVMERFCDMLAEVGKKDASLKKLADSFAAVLKAQNKGGEQ